MTHAAGDQIKAMVASVRLGLDAILAAAPPLPKAERWPALVRYIIAKIIGSKPKNHPQTTRSPPHPLLIPAG